MTGPDQRDDSWVVLDFLGRWHSDRESGHERPLREYLQAFPGHEEAIAREWAQLQHEEEPGEDGRRSIGPYELQRVLGSGGQGEVWLAHDPRLQRPVALKLLRESGGELRSNARFLREATLASRIEHPGICRIYELGASEGVPWIAMQYVEGESLAEKLRRRADGAAPLPLPEREQARQRSSSASQLLPAPSTAERPLFDVLGLVQEIAFALQAAHERGVVHRDLKPGNVIVTPEGQPVLLDFGLARETEPDTAQLTMSGAMFGTPAYMSPEQVEGREASPRSDVWALGVLLYELCTGDRPFTGPSQQALFDAIRQAQPERLAGRGLSRDLRAVLTMALAKEPERRYASCAAFASDLLALQRKEPVAARLPGPLLRTARWVARHRAVSALLLASIATLAIWSWRESAAREQESQLRELAETRSEQLRELLRGVIYEYQETLRDVPGALEANQALAERTLRFVELLSASDGDGDGEDDVHDLVMARLIAADLLGDVDRPHLGQLERARGLYEAALADVDDVAPEWRRKLLSARILGRLAKIDLSEGRLIVALDRYESACLLLADAGRRELQLEAARLWVELAQARLRDRRQERPHEAALEALNEGLGLFALLDSGAELSRELRVQRAWALLLASESNARRGESAKASEQQREAARGFEALVEHGRPSTQAILGLARCELTAGRRLIATRDGDAAEPIFARALSRLERLLEEDPDNQRARQALVTAHTERGYSWSVLGRDDAAKESYEAAIRIGEGARQSGALEGDLTRARLFRAELDYVGRRYEEAFSGFQALQRKCAERYERDPLDLAALRTRAIAWLYAAKSLFRLERSEEALAIMADVRQVYAELREKLPEDLRVLGGTTNALQTEGFAYFGLGRYTDALASFEAALEFALKTPGALRTRGILRISIGNALRQLDRGDEAATSYRKGYEELGELLRARPGDIYALRNRMEALVFAAEIQLLVAEGGGGERPGTAELEQALEEIAAARSRGVRDSKLLLMEANLHVLSAALAPAGSVLRRSHLSAVPEILEGLPERERANFALRERYQALSGL